MRWKIGVISQNFTREPENIPSTVNIIRLSNVLASKIGDKVGPWKLGSSGHPRRFKSVWIWTLWELSAVLLVVLNCYSLKRSAVQMIGIILCSRFWEIIRVSLYCTHLPQQHQQRSSTRPLKLWIITIKPSLHFGKLRFFAQAWLFVLVPGSGFPLRADWHVNLPLHPSPPPH